MVEKNFLLYLKKYLGKNINNNTIKKCFEICNEEKLPTTAYFTIGHPGERYNEILKTIKFSNILNPTFALFHPVKILPGSELFEISLKKGKIKKNIWKEVSEGKPVPIYIPDGLDEITIMNLQKRAWKEFYMNPKKILDITLNLDSLEDFVHSIKSGLYIIRDILR